MHIAVESCNVDILYADLLLSSFIVQKAIKLLIARPVGGCGDALQYLTLLDLLYLPSLDYPGPQILRQRLQVASYEAVEAFGDLPRVMIRAVG